MQQLNLRDMSRKFLSESRKWITSFANQRRRFASQSQSFTNQRRSSASSQKISQPYYFDAELSLEDNLVATKEKPSIGVVAAYAAGEFTAHHTQRHWSRARAQRHARETSSPAFDIWHHWPRFLIEDITIRDGTLVCVVWCSSRKEHSYDMTPEWNEFREWLNKVLCRFRKIPLDAIEALNDLEYAELLRESFLHRAVYLTEQENRTLCGFLPTPKVN